MDCQTLAPDMSTESGGSVDDGNAPPQPQPSLISRSAPPRHVHRVQRCHQINPRGAGASAAWLARLKSCVGVCSEAELLVTSVEDGAISEPLRSRAQTPSAIVGAHGAKEPFNRRRGAKSRAPHSIPSGRGKVALLRDHHRAPSQPARCRCKCRRLTQNARRARDHRRGLRICRDSPRATRCCPHGNVSKQVKLMCHLGAPGKNQLAMGRRLKRRTYERDASARGRLRTIPSGRATVGESAKILPSWGFGDHAEGA